MVFAIPWDTTVHDEVAEESYLSQNKKHITET